MAREKDEKNKKTNKPASEENQHLGDEGSEQEGLPSISLPYEEFDAMEKKMDSLQADLEQTRDSWIRSVADFDNYKKRVQRDAMRTQQDAIASILRIFLNVSDDLERALKHEPTEQSIESWVNGIELILQKLNTQLKNQGIERMKVEPGDEFDPTVHEAISQEDSPEFSDGQIIEVVQPGFRTADRVIRPAMVRVAR